MPVHAESVIQTWINDYNSNFYVSLTNKENDCYTRTSGSDKVHWKPLFTNLMTAINTWKSWSGREAKVQGLISSANSFMTLNLNFGINPSAASAFNAETIFDINGFIPEILAAPVNHFSDLVGSGVKTSAKITAAITKINDFAGAGANTESSKITSAISTAQPEVGKFANKAMFEDVTPIAPLLALEILDEGSNYADGNFTDIPLITLIGSGSGAKINIKVLNGKVLTALLAGTNGSGYMLKDEVGIDIDGNTSFRAQVAALKLSGKQAIGEHIFYTMGYKKVYQILNVGLLELPSYIT